MKKTYQLSGTDLTRIETLIRVKKGEISVGQAGVLLGLSRRQMFRIWGRYKKEGKGSITHGLRGRAGNRRRVEERAQAVALYRRHYPGIGAALAAHYLKTKHGITMNRNTLWRWLKAEGLVARTRRGKKHRIRRERMRCKGTMVQMDGSTHAWFECRGVVCVLFVMVDDATGRVTCRFYAKEDTRSAFDVFGRYVAKQGLPKSLYVDRDSIYRVNDEKARADGVERGRMPVTQFGRAMEQLGVRIICAHSPQAKGRVERMNGTMQDRLVKALRIEGISDIAAGNAFLDGVFLEEFNGQFARPAAEATDGHGPAPSAAALADILCIIERRSVGEDWCVRFNNRILQIHPRHEKLRLAGKKVDVHDLASGIKITFENRALEIRELAEKPAKEPAAKAPPKSGKKPWKPGRDHPWKKSAGTAAAVGAGSLRSPAPPCAAVPATPR